MPYTPLTDPFTIRFYKDEVEHEAQVIYAKETKCCANFFDVRVKVPQGIGQFYLKEKPTPGTEADSMIWVDKEDQAKMIYQVIGDEIEKYLRKDLGIFLIDAPVVKDGDDTGSQLND